MAREVDLSDVQQLPEVGSAQLFHLMLVSQSVQEFLNSVRVE